MNVDFEIKTKVRIDKGDVVGVVTAYQVRCNDYYIVEVSYIHNGTNCVAWFEPWRLEVA